MASSTKQNSEFTQANLGDGPSRGIVDMKGAKGQTIKAAYPQDNVHGMDLEDTKGGSMRGSPTNLEHSLKGSSAVQNGPGAAGPVKHMKGF